MTKQTITLIIATLFFSCNFEEKEVPTLSDSISIFNASINSKSFLRENLQYSDTLYIIKNKNYHEKYPDSSTHFKLFYLDNIPENKTINNPLKTVDNRERYEITDFLKKQDTIYLSLYNYGFREGFSFKFVKRKDVWIIVWERSVLN